MRVEATLTSECGGFAKGTSVWLMQPLHPALTHSSQTSCYSDRRLKRVQCLLETARSEAERGRQTMLAVQATEAAVCRALSIQ